MSEVTQEITYLEQRLAEYKIQEQDNQTSLTKIEYVHRKPTPKFSPAEWFSLTENGNIRILFKTLDNQELQLKGSNKWAQPFQRIRISPANIQRNTELHGFTAKYSQPKATGSVIWHSQGIIDTYLGKEKVPTLFLVEGEFKAFIANKYATGYEPRKKKEGAFQYPTLPGMPIMAITGIFNFKDDEKTGLHPDILEYIRVCQPESICLIYDADLFQPSTFDPENPHRDIGKRLKNFFQACADFRESAKGWVKDIYLVHPKEDYLKEDIKGLDDLMNRMNPQLILEELYKVGVKKSRFEFLDNYNISDSSRNDLKKLFLLKRTKGLPTDFYARYREMLKSFEFNFLGGRYKYDEQNEDLRMVAHADSEKYARIGSKYVKIIEIPDANGNHRRRIEPWSPTEIRRDYVEKGITNFFDTIPKYDAFCNVPQNDPEHYKQKISNCYNLYYPIDHEVLPGRYDTIMGYLTHLFGSEKNLEIALDWLYLVYNQPTVKLPVVCLVSREKNTGKSTFLWLLKEMFQENTVIVGNQEITDRFNDDFASKLIIGVDEGLIEKNVIVEKIKSWVTAPYINMDTKNLSRQQISFFAKIVMTSNNEKNFIRIDSDENRFWVIRVRPFEGKEDANLLEKMTEEIPAFLYFLKNHHKLKYQKENRLWFNPKLLENSVLNELRHESKSQVHKNIFLWIQDEFYKYNSNPEQPEKFLDLYYSISEIGERVFGKQRFSENRQYVKRVLVDEMMLEEPNKVTTVFRPQLDENRNQEYDQDQDYGGFYKVPDKGKKGRWYHFKIEDFIDEVGIEDMGIDLSKISETRALANLPPEEKPLPF